MPLILISAAIGAVAVAVVTLPFPLIKRNRRAWRRFVLLNLLLLPVDLFVIAPAMLGWAGGTLIGTRHDERGYAGPRLATDGSWLQQSRASLADERRSGDAQPPTVPPATLYAADGVPLRAFFVPTHRPPAGVSAVLVHGLFRGALELEPVGAMLREQGVHVLLLELRNHGGSGRAAPSFGLRESQDVLAAAAWLRAEPRTQRDRIVLFAVSLGTIATMLAAPSVPDLAGLALDAPVLDPLASAHAMLSDEQHPRRPAFPQPFRSLALWSLELWCGFSFDAIDPAASLAQLRADLPVLLVGGEHDSRVPPESVRQAAALLRSAELWIVPAAEHGNAFDEQREEYARRLAAWIARVRA